MLCEKCNNDSDVIDSRPVRNLIRRRRVCKSCGFSWKTFEISTTLKIDHFCAVNASDTAEAFEQLNVLSFALATIRDSADAAIHRAKHGAASTNDEAV